MVDEKRGHRDRQNSSVDATGHDDVSSLLESLLDRSARTILLSAIKRGKTIDELSDDGAIPLSTCYRKVKVLERQGLVVADGRALDAKGRRRTKYKSAFASLTFQLSGEGVLVEGAVNSLPDAGLVGKTDVFPRTVKVTWSGVG